MSENITQTELMEGIENTGKAFEEFKSTYNEKLTALEKKGSVDPLVDEKLKKIEGTLDSLEDFNQKATKIAMEQKKVSEKVDNF